MGRGYVVLFYFVRNFKECFCNFSIAFCNGVGVGRRKLPYNHVAGDIRVLHRYFGLSFIIGFSIGLLLLGCCFVIVNLGVNKIINNPSFRVEYFIDNYNDSFTPVESKEERFLAKTDITLRYGDNLFDLIMKHQFDRHDANEIISAIGDSVDIKKLTAGQIFHVDYSYNMVPKFYHELYGRSYGVDYQYYPEYQAFIEKRRVERIAFKLPDGVKYIVSRAGNKYVLDVEHPKLTSNRHVVSGVIHNNLFSDVLSFNMKASTLFNVLNEYAFLIDFQRDLHQGDKFVFVLDTHRDGDGDIIDEKVLYVNLILSGKSYEIFNFNGLFFDRKGDSVKKALLKTPIDGARISSRFNLHRKHPILGYTKAHLGVDLAAPTGTPIYSAGDGIITAKKRHENYGNYVEVRHNKEYTTRYAHMSKFANVHVGQRVSQRQIIGYVGMTGRATGPHLHYEVIRNGSHINPSSIKVSSTKHIDVAKINVFKSIVKEIDDFLKKSFSF